MASDIKVTPATDAGAPDVVGVAFYDRLPFRLSGHNPEIIYYLYFMERIVFKL